METVTACVTAILSPIVEDVVKSTGRQVGYIFRFKSIIKDLKEEAENLRLAQENMQHRVDGAIKDTDEIEKDVEKWLKDVTDVVADAEDLYKQTREKKTCLSGLCQMARRYQMARRAQKKISTMSKLKDGGNFGIISHRTTLSGINVLTAKDFMLFESITNSFNLIIEALKDDKMNVVGLYGMGGVGLNDDQSPTTIKLAKEVVEECKGLPLAIVTIGSALKEKPIDEWKIATQKLRKSKLMDVDIVDEKLYTCLKLSYDYLKNEKTKSCFLLCSLFPEDHEIDVEQLVRYGLGYDIRVDDDDDDDDEGASYPKSRLLKIRGIEATSLVAFKALCEKSGVEYLELREIKGCCQNMVPSIDETGLNELKRLSLCDLIGLECIIDTTHQKDVASTAFSNLVDLSLDNVGLREICSGGRPPRGFLENLETLDIRRCSLFPSWVLIQRLRKLKKVTVHGCGELEDVFQLEGLCYAKENPFLLSSLESLDLWKLENLMYIWKGPTQQVSLQSLTVVKVGLCNKLRYLFTLSLARSLLRLEQLMVYECDSLEHIVEIEAEENVGGGGGNDVMFPKLRKLQLRELKNFINFYSENSSLNLRTAKEQLRSLNLWRHGLQNLEELMIGGCRRVQVLFQLEGVEQELSLPSLKVLELEYLRELECLCKGPTHLLSLPNLKKLKVDSCNRLRHIFSPSLARNLLQLEELIIWWCGELEYIVSIKAEENVGGGGGNDVMLPKLRILKLDGVENCISFFDSENLSLNVQTTKKQLRGLNLWRHGLQNLEELEIRRCRWVQVLFQLEGVEQELSLPSLKVLELSGLEELECLCMGPTHLLSLQNLKKLKVNRCFRLRHMFSPSLARNLLQLEELSITGCGELEYIVSIKAEESVGGGGGNDVMLPKLRILKLDGVENFISFFDSENLSLNMQTTKKQLRGLRHGLPNLEKLYIWNCRVQVLFHLEGLEQELAFPSLKVLDLYNLEELECLCKGPTHLLSLPNLKKLEVWGCNRPRHMFSPSLARNLLQLEELIIWHCEKLEYIVSIKAEENVGGGGGNDVMLPKLRILRLSRVENFIDFCSENSSLNVQTTKKQLRGLRHGFPNLEELDISGCRVQVLFHLEGLEQELAFPSLKVLELYGLKELECLCKGPTHLLSLPNLKKLKVWRCNRLRHMFSPSLARNFMQLEELIIEDCGEMEQIFIEDDAAEYHPTLLKDHLQWPLLLPNLSSISIKECDKLKTLFPAVITARSGLQKLKTLIVGSSSQLEELFGHKDEADMTSDRQMVLPQLQKLTLQELASLVNFCPIGYHFKFPSLSELVVSRCPKITTRFSVDQNRSVYAEAEAPQTGKEEVDMEQSPPKTTREIYCWNPDDLRKRLYDIGLEELIRYGLLALGSNTIDEAKNHLCVMLPAIYMGNYKPSARNMSMAASMRSGCRSLTGATL
ncbi:hypothetical protein Q3G72_019812 [Acer saccharum]|nr:hypothetical protein Q3G72_019812 [Acer saccharum]